MSAVINTKTKSESSQTKTNNQMSFLDHIDELRKRLTYSIFFVGIAFIFCWVFSDKIFAFLAVPVRQAISDAQNKQVNLTGLNGDEKILPLSELKEGETGTHIFLFSTKIGNTVIPVGTAVKAKVARDVNNNLALFTEDEIFTNNSIIPKGIKLPADLDDKSKTLGGIGDKLVVTTAIEPFTLYVTVSLYAAIALSVPFLLWQIWGFVSPGLYEHEKSYVTPFIILSSVCFICGIAFAYYILFPPVARYLLGLGQDFNLLLKATDYFDFIILIMLAMGGIFQMPAITYILARIGIVSAGLLIKSWRIAIIAILLGAAILSPTGDALNLVLFASPMVVLYGISIGIAWIFGQKRVIPNEI
jgi:sec-independent protein translocase protein TatC